MRWQTEIKDRATDITVGLCLTLKPSRKAGGQQFSPLFTMWRCLETPQAGVRTRGCWCKGWAPITMVALGVRLPRCPVQSNFRVIAVWLHVFYGHERAGGFTMNVCSCRSRREASRSLHSKPTAPATRDIYLTLKCPRLRSLWSQDAGK